MDLFQTMRIYCAIVDESSFTAAGARVGVSKALASRSLSQLEAHLGVRLLNRSTRRISLTEAGARYYEHCRDLLESNAEIESRLGEAQARATGLLRVNAPVSLGAAHIAPLLPAFYAQHPDVRIELELVDRLVDLIEEAVDVAVRVGHHAPPAAIARKIGETRLRVVGAPALFAARGKPESKEALHDWPRLYYSLALGPAWWRAGGGEAHSPFQSNSGDAIVKIAESGAGLALLPEFILRPALAAGTLVDAFAEPIDSAMPISAIYPHRERLPLKTRVFVDFVAQAFAARRAEI